MMALISKAFPDNEIGGMGFFPCRLFLSIHIA